MPISLLTLNTGGVSMTLLHGNRKKEFPGEEGSSVLVEQIPLIARLHVAHLQPFLVLETTHFY